MFKRHLSGILNLGGTPTKQLVGSSGSHGTSHANFALTSHLGARDGGIGAHNIAHQASCHQGTDNAKVGKLITF